MRINDLIQKLLETSQKHGNLEVYVNSTDYDFEPTRHFTIEVREKIEFDHDHMRNISSCWVDNKVELIGNEAELDKKYLLLD